MNNEKLHKYLAHLDGRSPGNEKIAIAKLKDQGVDIPELLAKRYEVSRRWSDRALCLSHCVEYAKTNEAAYQLGILALKDRSRTVRRTACTLLSIAQRKEAIEHLERLLSDDAIKADAEAVIGTLAKQGQD